MLRGFYGVMLATAFVYAQSTTVPDKAISEATDIDENTLQERTIRILYDKYFSEGLEVMHNNSIVDICAEIRNSHHVFVNGTEYLLTYDSPTKSRVLSAYKQPPEMYIATSEFDQLLSGHAEPSRKTIEMAEVNNNFNISDCYHIAVQFVYAMTGDDWYVADGYMPQNSEDQSNNSTSQSLTKRGSVCSNEGTPCSNRNLDCQTEGTANDPRTYWCMCADYMMRQGRANVMDIMACVTGEYKGRGGLSVASNYDLNNYSEGNMHYILRELFATFAMFGVYQKWSNNSGRV